MTSLLQYAYALVGTPYQYGGNNPLTGLDCSGLVCELLRSEGLIGREDLGAQMLFDKFSKLEGTIKDKSGPGALVFFGKSVSEISHVGLMVSAFQMIEAGGGDSTTISPAVAAKQNAFVRVRPVDARKDRVAVLMPVYREI